MIPRESLDEIQKITLSPDNLENYKDANKLNAKESLQNLDQRFTFGDNQKSNALLQGVENLSNLSQAHSGIKFSDN